MQATYIMKLGLAGVIASWPCLVLCNLKIEIERVKCINTKRPCFFTSKGNEQSFQLFISQ